MQMSFGDKERQYPEEHNHHEHRYEHNHHDGHGEHDEIPPCVIDEPPKLNAGIRCHACGCEGGQNICEGGDQSDEGDGFVMICRRCMHDRLVLDETNSVQGDEGLGEHQFENAAFERQFIPVAGRLTRLGDVMRALDESGLSQCRRCSVQPFPDSFWQDRISPRGSGWVSPSPTESMLVEPGSTQVSPFSSRSLTGAAATPSLAHMGGWTEIDTAFPRLPNFTDGGPLWMGPERPRRNGYRTGSLSMDEDDSSDDED